MEVTDGTQPAARRDHNPEERARAEPLCRRRGHEKEAERGYVHA